MRIRERAKCAVGCIPCQVPEEGGRRGWSSGYTPSAYFWRRRDETRLICAIFSERREKILGGRESSARMEKKGANTESGYLLEISEERESLVYWKCFNTRESEGVAWICIFRVCL